jgi:hypothetical protein
MLALKRYMVFKEQENFQAVLRAAEETETKQDNIQDWLELPEGDPVFQLLTEEEIAAVTFSFISIITTYIIEYCIHFFSNFFVEPRCSRVV